MVKVKPNIITNKFIDEICTRLAENKQVRRTLPGWGRLHIDRQLPFLCIYRRKNSEDVSMSERLIMGEASYLFAEGDRRKHKQLSALIKNIAVTLKKIFGTFLILEIFTEEGTHSEFPLYNPAFKIIRPKNSSILSTIETLEGKLRDVNVRKVLGEVEVISSAKISQPGLIPIMSPADAKKLGCHLLAIEVRPIYRNEVKGQIFPLIRRDLQRGFSRALKNCFFEFTHKNTSHRPMHYMSLGRWSMVKAVWEVDSKLAEICNGFDFLLQVTPVNSNSAWSAFQRSRYQKMPEFVYRPLPIDPSLAKRRLFALPIERIEDPTLAQLFHEQQVELDRKFTMLLDRGTKRFLYGSLQLYGEVEDSLMKLSKDILEQFSPRSRDESYKSFVNANDFASRAALELAYFKKIFPESKSKVIVREDITGLMVSQGNLLVGSNLKIPATRVEALIQHEVGTHVLTYLNGKAQPFKQLFVGLAGYEALQEGLAVLSEYLVGGLTRPRMRMLAARVVAARHMENGASFVEIFKELNKTYGFERRTAFTITMRTFRSGGLTKDAVYLRGLVQLLKYLKNGGVLEHLFVGKISVDHVAIINELQWRKVLRPAPLMPRYLDDQQTKIKLNSLRNGLTPIKLIKRSKP